ncbi:MAG TPA: hypothetical protein PK335_10785 [Draconibacterium sp.]|nr:hypothetical protein [Draconibacterium sp.]
MKRLFTLLILFITFVSGTYAKKDINAWKSESNIRDQYTVFKQNLNYWAGNYVVSSNQLDEFFGAVNDTISKLETKLQERMLEISQQRDDLAQRQALVNETQKKLDESQKLQNSISVLGMDINKNVYSVTMYLFILAVLIIAGVMYMMYMKSMKNTRHTRKEYEELKQEYEEHKKTALDRYTKINMELHKTRLELQKK